MKMLNKLLQCLLVFIALVHSATAEINHEKNVLFVSFSMPKESLNAIIDTAAKIDAPVLLRGFYKHSFKETFTKINALTLNKKTTLQIHPEAFREYGVSKVPALVVDNGKSFRVYYGDVAIADILGFIAREENAFSDIAQSALKKLKSANV